MSDTILYDYWRSSASYRVRIALNCLDIRYDRVPVNLLANEQSGPEHIQRNPQGLVPALSIDGLMLTQSIAIVEYLNESRGGGFLPNDYEGRARVRAMSFAIAMDIHPIANLSVLNHVAEISYEPDAKKIWVNHFVSKGLRAFEAMLKTSAGRFSFGDTLSMADICLIPQIYNAERWSVDLAPFPKCMSIAQHCSQLPTFAAAHPDAVKPNSV